MMNAKRAIARRIIRRADAARDDQRFHDAALLYAEVLEILPRHAGMHVQRGHMLKELGDAAGARQHYLRATELAPGDSDAALQLALIQQSMGQLDTARAGYRRALALTPGLASAQTSLDRLDAAGWRGFDAAGHPAVASEALISPFTTAEAAAELRRADDVQLAPELAPLGKIALWRDHREGMRLRWLGRDERTAWGWRPTLRGVEAVRGFCISAIPIEEIELLIADTLVIRVRPLAGHVIAHEPPGSIRRKYVFNIWFDFSGFVPGRYRCDIRARHNGAPVHSLQREIVIAPPLAEADFPASDALVAVDRQDPRSIEEQLAARPSMVRPARRALLASPPRTILVQRPDQLGDLVVSIPAVRRLRELFPDAVLVGLLSHANAGLAESLALFDHVIRIDFPEDRDERRRIMPIAEQAALRDQLVPYKFDMAIDFSELKWTRKLLLLSGAPFLVGFRGGEVRLDVEVDGNTYDRMNNHEVVPHTNKLLGLVEWLAAMLRSEPNVVPRTDLERDRLATFGLLPDDRFVVLHDGARLQFSRWPHYPALAQALLDTTDLHVVLLTDDRAARGGLPSALADHPRFHLVDERLAFDDFDALVSFCAAFVGNDSGPKHLASFRGAQVVSLHTARNNWNEWGQENGGLIISRKVPCAGCLIHHDPEECGKGFVCIRDISVDEVLRAVLSLL